MNPGFQKYQEKEALHEAGFDSYLTARIMILLSAKLNYEAKKALRQATLKPMSRQNSPEFGLPLLPVSMPSFEEDFWQEYGNRLRVFGTTETFMELNPERRQTLAIRLANGQ
jgi:hypothetical protein